MRKRGREGGREEREGGGRDGREGGGREEGGREGREGKIILMRNQITPVLDHFLFSHIYI